MQELHRLKLAMLVMKGFKFSVWEEYGIYHVKITSPNGKVYEKDGGWAVDELIDEVYEIFPIADEVLRDMPQ